MPRKAPIEVNVVKVGGDIIALCMERQTTMLLLKHKLAELWNIPPVCQYLSHSGQVLDNRCTLASLRDKHCRKIILSCVISCENVFACLEKFGSATPGHDEALHALVVMSHVDYDRSLKILWNQLLQRTMGILGGNRDCREELPAQGIVRLARANDGSRAEEIMNMLVANLQHPHGRIREVSVYIIGRIAKTGDGFAIAILCDQASDSYSSVKREVATSLRILATPEQSSAMCAVLQLAGDACPEVRKCAMETLQAWFPSSTENELRRCVDVFEVSQRGHQILADLDA
eukprot:TRINITY_DN55727_c0_g1_i1.p1 TRINITY_DN55727_c0_g1~~TRINITY_DN55727_c0_g1_i1.p1  ORF type:complete len:288 (-),score=33.25 TRINITY_DN55727_c0_g1_i1:116-979(-)